MENYILVSFRSFLYHFRKYNRKRSNEEDEKQKHI